MYLYLHSHYNVAGEAEHLHILPGSPLVSTTAGVERRSLEWPVPLHVAWPRSPARVIVAVTGHYQSEPVGHRFFSGDPVNLLQAKKTYSTIATDLQQQESYYYREEDGAQLKVHYSLDCESAPGGDSGDALTMRPCLLESRQTLYDPFDSLSIHDGSRSVFTRLSTHAELI
ncbi:hypothetical protein N7539_000767 [Penicillium diatomitis]|uniref:Uncharacterized protein n=1 Tax=Penicillium diatomitis TaxID=2819901 RepID=A0A9W9XMA6_9EURO|nr:uncharacterized protein N7539_000767 [Penicillium diatomitis]KAJ5495651.1 hypothetical protein N7539_000767 [Penicillium diatomitis]